MSQVNFFMAATDESEFFGFLSQRGDTTAVAGRSFPSSSPPTLDLSLPGLPNGNDITLLHREISQTPSCGDDGLFRYELFRHAFIEFSRSVRSDEVMISGRIYAKIGWLDDSEANEAFRAWYNSIERWIKKRYSKIHDHWWVGPSAETWSRSGGQLALGNTLAARVSLADGPFG
ncbi:hypothetical protein [Rhodopirellula halodulae]|uniref:hypothetical protein n=1 Tax=Rhodopirellula halodulae TaxID=2894198 RepID=UPI001E287974|nr:hypothetical protein [Rhodopirellula sp. JC737]MCC9658817.1 hypothetical protein [Rhodopirellula sp. JC737]